MRICLINTLYDPYVLGGVEVYLQALYALLDGAHEVAVITSAPYTGRRSLSPRLTTRGQAKTYEFYPLNFFHLAKRPRQAVVKAAWYAVDLYNVHAGWAIRRALQIVRPDVVHTHNLRGLSLAAWDAAQSLGLPIVHHLHDYYLLCRNSMLMHGNEMRSCEQGSGPCRAYRWWMRRLAGHRPDTVLSPSRFVLEAHQRFGLFNHSRKALIPYWLLRLPGDAGETGQASGELRVLFVGTVSRHKGVRYLVEAFQQMNDASASLEVAGHGDQELAECRRLAVGDSRIRFLGFVDGAEKEAAFRRANVVVVPSIWHDNAPVVITESQARGKAVVASAMGGVPELIEHDVTGMLVPPRDASALARALEALKDDPDMRRRLGAAARAATHKLSANEHLRQLAAIYQSPRDMAAPN